MSLDYILKNQIPQSGRRVKENGELFNQADYEFLQNLIDPTANVFRGNGYFWQHLRKLVPNGNVYYYSVVTPPTKHMVIYSRNFSAGEGPVEFETVVGATFTPGSAVSAINLFAGKSAAQSVFTAGVTAVSGGVTAPIDYLFGAGNNTAVAASAGLPTIFPPNITILIKVSDLGSGTNPGIRLALGFAEIEIPEGFI